MVKNLKKLRKERHLSQGQLADMAGVVQQSIAQYEGKFEPDIYTLGRLADALNVSIDYLVGHSQYRQPL